MLKCFYRLGDEVVFTQSQKEIAAISRDNIIWIDLLNPTGEEKRSVESFLNIEIQSRAEAEEIESSSRFYEESKSIFANTNFLSPADDGMIADPVSFILSGKILTTLREIPLRTFNVIQNKIQALPDEFDNGFEIFVEIMDKRVDLDADIVELISKDTAQFSKRINQKEDINEEFLLDINQLQENAMIVRENVVDKQRLLSNILKSKLCPKDAKLREDLTTILQDIASLISHTNFTFERLEYLQDTAVGIINLDQNNIMKIFTFISLLLMPATLVTSFYGMNVALPFDGAKFSWLFILIGMIIVVVILWYVFKKRKML